MKAIKIPQDVAEWIFNYMLNGSYPKGHTVQEVVSMAQVLQQAAEKVNGPS